MKDELLWGYLGRLRVHWLLPNARALSRWVLGINNRHTACTDFQSSADSLNRSLHGLGLTPETWIRMHTLLPYYIAFRPAPDKAALFQRALSPSIRGLHLKLGLASSRVTLPMYFRYCPACWKCEQQEWGEVCVRRLFQLPGVLVCPLHGEWLCDTVVLYRHVSANEFRWVRPEDGTGRSSSSLVGHEIDSVARRLAFASQRLLDLEEHGGVAVDVMHGTYRQAVAQLGYGRDHLRLTALEEAFLGRIPALLLQSLGLALEPGHEANWLRRFLRKPRGNPHPLQHLLFREFVEAELGPDCWRELERQVWPCLSPLVPHPGQMQVEAVSIRWDATCNRWQGIFQCGCGFRYSASGDGRPSPRKLELKRVIHHSPVLAERVRAMAKSGCSVTRIAARVGLHRRSVEGLLQRALGDDARKFRLRWNMWQDRATWLQLQQEQPKAGMNFLCRENAALAARLRRHDAGWLDMHRPPQQFPAVVSRHHHWPLKEIALYQCIATKLEELEKRVPPRRITVNGVGRELGITTLLKKSLHKLPSIRALLDMRCESVQTFQLRRLACLTTRPDFMPKSRRALMRMAGLNSKSIRPAARVLVDELIAQWAR